MITFSNAKMMRAACKRFIKVTKTLAKALQKKHSKEYRQKVIKDHDEARDAIKELSMMMLAPPTGFVTPQEAWKSHKKKVKARKKAKK